MDTANNQGFEIFLKHLHLLWGMEQAIVKALPKIIDQARDEGLKNVLRLHYAETLNQTSALRGIFKQLELTAQGDAESSFEQMLRGGVDDIDIGNNRNHESDLRLISAVKKVELYEIDQYMKAVIEAGNQNLDGVEKTLLVILNEEKLASVKLNFLKKNIEELMSQPHAESVF